LSEHLTAGNLRQYLDRAVLPATLLSWDDHLAECAECRGLLLPNAVLAKWADGLGQFATEDFATEDEDRHLSYEQLVARAEGRVGPSEQFAIESHLKTCGACAEEVGDLKQFRPAVKWRSHAPIWLGAVAAALVLAALALPSSCENR